MPTAVVMPKLGNSVESSIIVAWKKRPGDAVAAGEPLLEVETDKASIEVESPAAGTLLAIFSQAGEDVPVMTTIGAIGAPGEDYSSLAPAGSAPSAPPPAPAAPEPAPVSAAPAPIPLNATPTTAPASPRARGLAQRKGLTLAGVPGTGPGGRIIERDVLAALSRQPKLTPVAERMVAQGAFTVPDSAAGKRVTTKDLIPADAPAAPALAASAPAPTDGVQIFPLKGVRKVIATRMLASLQTTAQLTLNSFADARGLRALRERLKTSGDAYGLRGVTINDLIMFAVARTLPDFRDLNTHLKEDALHQFAAVHLGFAVDTPKGLIVPVIHQADRLSLRDLSRESARLAKAAQDGTIKPDDLEGGTFTVTNLGSLGIDTFTPVLNPPQVGILGVGGIALRAVEVGGDIQHIPHLALSLTIDHRAVDGAPGARFLQAVSRALAHIDVLLAV